MGFDTLYRVQFCEAQLSGSLFKDRVQFSAENWCTAWQRIAKRGGSKASRSDAKTGYDPLDHARAR